MEQRHPTENGKVTKFSRDIAHTELFDDLYKQVCNEYQWHSVYHIAFEKLQHPGPQWHSDCYIVFFWQLFSAIPKALRVSYSLCWKSLQLESQWYSEYYRDFFCQTLFDNPNVTATITWSDFGKSFLTIPMAQRLLHGLILASHFWQSQWHSGCHMICVQILYISNQILCFLEQSQWRGDFSFVLSTSSNDTATGRCLYWKIPMGRGPILYFFKVRSITASNR